MNKTTEEVLESLLLPVGSDWKIANVNIDDSNECIYVDVKYDSDTVTVAGKRFPIFDLRPERTWRHLDLWQYKTYIRARIPRYKPEGKPISLEVPWADPLERITSLLEKKR